ncbi:MAG: ATP-binding protein [Dysgonamonadaceae bacterium]|jgi:hypothetical protein|nr:ATP-binding protein [Dysgonamonadaceae bacterium]
MKKLPSGIQVFEDIITDNYVYVDKTKYLVELIEKGKIYFYARPRRFGKTLTISTLKAMFEGRKDLFKGLYAEALMHRPDFKPCPVIRLDMSMPATSAGLDYLHKSMKLLVIDCADDLGISIPDGYNASDSLKYLIKSACEKYGERVAVLIDEYDKPYTDFFTEPDKAAKIREMLRDFYVQLKANEDYIRFVFITGISKFTKMGVFSTLNNLTDVSMMPEFGEMCGMTEAEIAGNFPEQLDDAAKKFNISREELIGKMRNYYDGFSFDGIHRLYNPYSTIQFLFQKDFKNYWMTSGGQLAVREYMKHRHLSLEQFRDVQVSKNFLDMPGDMDTTSPEGFFYQSGYLSIREGRTDDYSLDFPNSEVLDAMSALLAENLAEEKGETFFNFRNDILTSLYYQNTGLLIDVMNRFLSSIPYDDFAMAARQSINSQNLKMTVNEWLYRSNLLAFFRGSGVLTFGEMHSNKGRSDIVLSNKGRTFILELKVAFKSENVEQKAEEALSQITNNHYASPYPGAISIGIAIDDEQKAIGAWKKSHFPCTPQNNPLPLPSQVKN